MIRNFIYLDSDKLRSLSSQLFEGVTEQVISSRTDSKAEKEQQKGPVASGRVLADIFSQDKSTSELRFLEDHAYTLFESRLLELGLITELDEASLLDSAERNFIKVTAKLKLNDLAASAELIRDFNKIGESLWRVTNEQMVWTPNGPKVAAEGDARRKAGEAGLQLNQKVSDAAATLTEFGFQDLIEAHMEISDGTFSAPLKRGFLREEESMIIHKYSRLTQADFTMVGVITQRGAVQEEEIPAPPDVSEADAMRHAMRLLANHIRVVENNFSGPMSNEIILDPIAVYSVIQP